MSCRTIVVRRLPWLAIVVGGLVAEAALVHRSSSFVIVEESPPSSAMGADLAQLDPEFFSEDEDKMKEFKEYATTATPTAPLTVDGIPRDDICGPKCEWACGPHMSCNQVCEPKCAPPLCRTVCGRDPDKCSTRCAAPQCAVVCPEAECRTGGAGCAKCKTVCSPPICTTACGENCRNVCEKPRCTWKCAQPDCPKPHCQMACNGFKNCLSEFGRVNGTIPSPYPGKPTVGKTEGYASLDPGILSLKVTPPPAFEHVEVRRREDTTTTSTTPEPLGPVAALKLKWKQEDALKKAEEERRERARREAEAAEQRASAR